MSRTKFTPEQETDIARALILREGTWAQIRQRFGVSQCTLTRIVKAARASGAFDNIPPAPRGPMRKLTVTQRSQVISTLGAVKRPWPAMPALAAQHGVHVSTIERHWIQHLLRHGLTRSQRVYRATQKLRQMANRVPRETSINGLTQHDIAQESA